MPVLRGVGCGVEHGRSASLPRAAAGGKSTGAVATRTAPEARCLLCLQGNWHDSRFEQQKCEEETTVAKHMNYFIMAVNWILLFTERQEFLFFLLGGENFVG
ncbi:unnamed protein product [Parnassius apollo]|uniref:(apollo) hypothetical protein n=1 Tax=Parnassius apollo TaxID=110799 RepID=A0A8S3WTR2_PARAO|nr:unnamed protein product [Parnassius apollo]